MLLSGSICEEEVRFDYGEEEMMNETVQRRLKELKKVSTQELAEMIAKAETECCCDRLWYGRVDYRSMAKLVYLEQLYTARKLLEQERAEKAALKAAKEADGKRRREVAAAERKMRKATCANFTQVAGKVDAAAKKRRPA